MTPEDATAAQSSCHTVAWAWVLEDLRRVEPFQVVGKQWLFEATLPA